jgi:hypothetical protein
MLETPNIYYIRFARFCKGKTGNIILAENKKRCCSMVTCRVASINFLPLLNSIFYLVKSFTLDYSRSVLIKFEFLISRS